jgi:hypothetical protein
MLFLASPVVAARGEERGEGGWTTEGYRFPSLATPEERAILWLQTSWDRVMNTI